MSGQYRCHGLPEGHRPDNPKPGRRLPVGGQEQPTQSAQCHRRCVCRFALESFEHTKQTRGRTGLQHVQVIANTDQIDTGVWIDCKCIGRVVSLRVDGKKRQRLETRYYISSAQLDHQALFNSVRQHWGIENRLHWSLDVIFREDASKIRKDHGPRNIGLIRKIILKVLRQDEAHPKESRRGRRKMAGWDDDERACVCSGSLRYDGEVRAPWPPDFARRTSNSGAQCTL